jgi:Fe-S-cluster-containing dehydrogenase component
MAILQEVDKCVRCNGCVIACKRTWHMKGDVDASPDLPHNKLASNQRLVIKSQKRVDMGPFVRFSCWHCEDPPCAGRCPFKAIEKSEGTGAVWIDPNKCKPGECSWQCKTDCQRGGVPMIGAGSDLFETAKNWKCTLCTGGYTGAPCVGAGKGGDLPTRAVSVSGLYHSKLYPDVEVEELASEPSCVYTCPAKAMIYDTRENIVAYLNDPNQHWVSRFGDGAMFWASKKSIISPPKADPFVEDHISPMVGSLLNSPFAKAALVPTLVVGGLLAISARRAKIAEETLIEAGEVR